MYESTIVKKLRLGGNFPRAVLDSRKKSVGIGLIKPKTAVEIFSCKLYIGNARAATKISKIIRYQEELVAIEHGRACKGKEPRSDKPTAWEEEVNFLLKERNLEIRNKEKDKIRTRNVTIMD